MPTFPIILPSHPSSIHHPFLIILMLSCRQIILIIIHNNNNKWSWSPWELRVIVGEPPEALAPWTVDDAAGFGVMASDAEAPPLESSQAVSWASLPALKRTT